MEKYNEKIFEEAREIYLKLLDSRNKDAARLWNIIEEMHGYAITPQSLSPESGEQDAVFTEFATRMSNYIQFGIGLEEMKKDFHITKK